MRCEIGLVVACGLVLASGATEPVRAQGRNERVSVATSGAQGNNASTNPSISADGRFVVFESLATNLVPGGDQLFRTNVFVRDRKTRTTRQVSVSSEGRPADVGSVGSTISANGRFVAFASAATNLVPRDTNDDWDVFVHDRQTRTTRRVSVGPNGVQGNAGSSDPAISANGRFVVFASDAANLVPGDTNAFEDIFVHDRKTRTTRRVSVGPSGRQANAASALPAISADGRFVAFVSAATNLVPGDTNREWDVFVHDLKTRTTRRVSVGRDGRQGNGGSLGPSISADGRYVAFYSLATNLVPADTNGLSDLFVHDRKTGTNRRLAVAPGSESVGPGSSPSISADARSVAFESDATSLVPGDTNGFRDVFVRTLARN